MSDWSSYAAGKVKQQRENQGLRDARALQEESILALYAPKRWEELRGLLMQMCTEFNAEPNMRNTLAYDNSDPNALKIENIVTRINSRVTFDPERHEIKVNSPGSSLGDGTYYRIAVISGQRETYFSDGNRSIEAHEIARKTLDSLLGI
jgi:alanine-alpha-ketoisovalerate/valine-pyruvate aminotransferase